MPSKTEKQRQMMAIAEHHPGKLYKRNRGVLKMSKQQLHEFASSTKSSPPATAEDMERGYKKIDWPED